MKKQLTLLSLCFLLAFRSALGQETTGIKFEHALNWEQVKAKAKAENKHIFIDAYTTWCGPCKVMAKDIFPLKEVGDFYNANFINLKIQLDSTKDDDDFVKRWRSDARKIATQYEVRAYPTYLFLNPAGEIVHRALGSSPASVFISKGKDALDPDKQYYSLKRQYEQGKKDPDFLLLFTKAAIQANDSKMTSIVANEYLATQKDLTQPENLKILIQTTRKVSDPGFSILLNESEKADSVLGKGRSANAVKQIIFNDVVMPYLRSGKDVKKEIDWNEIKAKLQSDFPKFEEEVLLKAQTLHYSRNKDFPNLTTAVNATLTKYPESLTKPELNNLAWMLFQKCEDAECLKAALAWSKQTLEGKWAKETIFLDTYANLLYKTGNKEEAIKVETEAVELSGEKDANGNLTKVLDKMKKGEKTW